MGDVGRYSNVTVNYNLSISNEEGSNLLGDHEWLLLKNIHTHGSLKAASELMGISYRKAWGDIRRTEEFLGFTLIEKHRGGEKGGNSLLTDDGQKFLAAFSELRDNFQQAVNESIIHFKKRIKDKI